MADNTNVTISIMGRDYPINCPPSDVEGLRQSAEHLNRQMQDIKTKGSMLGFENLAVLAALNICHELINIKNNASATRNDSETEIKALEDKIDRALQQTRQMEI
jgi:cell division protein ZapA